ncbi:hypothetical protein HD806DRAFT_538294 [Xylariaceae sp. AK1471]|nr:hypothetical protein HD806DRAFT_538294 [Xylariaceae sp. AK1471]
MALDPNIKQVIDISSLPDISRHEHEFHDTSFFQSQAGSISRGPVQDRFFHFDYVEGPFLTIKSFQDWLLAAATRQQVRPDNIIVSSDEYGAYHIAGIIDWEQAGWYPEYREYFKLYYGVEIDHKWWTEGWADKVMKPFEDEFIAVAEYSLWRNP